MPLVLRSEFSRLAGVTGAAIARAITSQLKDAYNGRKIDTDHPDAIKYIADAKIKNDQRALRDAKDPSRITRRKASRSGKHARGTTVAKNDRMAATAGVKRKPKSSVKKPVTVVDDEVIHDSDDVSQYLNMTLSAIIEKFGTGGKFIDWLKAVKGIEDIRDRRLRNDEREGLYVPREIVEKVIGEFERCFLLQLRDASKTIASQIIASAKAGESISVSRGIAEDMIGAPISDAKKKIQDLLKEYK